MSGVVKRIFANVQRISVQTTVQEQSVRFRFLLLVVCLGAFSSHMTAGVVNVALPGLSSAFHQDLSIIQWITTEYLLVVAVCLPIMGKLADRFGKIRMHNTGLVLFLTGSLLISVSQNLASLLVFRFFQGLGSSMFQATNIVLVSMYAPEEKRGKSLGYVSMAVALGGLLGPVIGGIIYQWLPWRFLFLAHCPFVGLAYWLALKYVPAADRGVKQKIDLPGAVLFSCLIVTVVLGVSLGKQLGWNSPAIWMVFSAVLFLVVLLLRRESNCRDPFLPITLLRQGTVGTGVYISGATYLIVFSGQAVMPFYLKEAVKLQPAEIGLMMTAYPVVLAVSGPICGGLSDKFGSWFLTMTGLFAMGAGCVGLTMIGDNGSLYIVAVLLILLGLGMGMVTSPNYSLIMSSVPAEKVGIIGGFIALARNLGLLFGAALGLSMVQSFHLIATGIHLTFWVGLVLDVFCIMMLYKTKGTS